MILNTKQNTIETYGDIKENEVSIDPRNIQHIITILSSNLYSNPQQSFLREIISNAWDSHVEANNTKEPVIVTFKQGLSNNSSSIAIRDYGTGISPERFNDIYLNIGSSTKRESNDYIGAFGIDSCAA